MLQNATRVFSVTDTTSWPGAMLFPSPVLAHGATHLFVACQRTVTMEDGKPGVHAVNTDADCV